MKLNAGEWTLLAGDPSIQDGLQRGRVLRVGGCEVAQIGLNPRQPGLTEVTYEISFGIEHADDPSRALAG
ncbi:MAG: hypothetical protein OXG46_02670 [Chloroflexi bacterium]|nr:hypothetical protein [Chloroflexota bacterium]